jgi:6-phosphofructokinase
MPLVKATLEASLKTRIKAIDAEGGDVSDKIAAIIADEIDKYIKTATVTIPLGIPVTTAGSAVAQTGATTAPGIGTLS